MRLTGLLQPPATGAARLELRPYLRTSRMEFLQHFLLGKPLERNGQESAGLMTTLVWDDDPDRTADRRTRPRGRRLVPGRGPGRTRRLTAARRPTRSGRRGCTTTTTSARTSRRSMRMASSASWSAGARRPDCAREYVSYDYDNRMLAGNTDENGVPCGASGCLYSRPADRTDDVLQRGAQAQPRRRSPRTGSWLTRPRRSDSGRPRSPSSTGCSAASASRTSTPSGSTRSRLGLKASSALADVATRAVRHAQGGRHPARVERLQRQQWPDLASRRRVRPALAADRRARVRRAPGTLRAASVRVLAARSRAARPS